jgi:hypothetical protein
MLSLAAAAFIQLLLLLLPFSAPNAAVANVQWLLLRLLQIGCQ